MYAERKSLILNILFTTIYTRLNPKLIEAISFRYSNQVEIRKTKSDMCRFVCLLAFSHSCTKLECYRLITSFIGLITAYNRRPWFCRFFFVSFSCRLYFKFSVHFIMTKSEDVSRNIARNLWFKNTGTIFWGKHFFNFSENFPRILLPKIFPKFPLKTQSLPNIDHSPFESF